MVNNDHEKPIFRIKLTKESIMDFIKEISDIPVILKSYMKKSRLTNSGLAVLMGKDPASLSRLLNGKREIPLDTLLKLLRYMGYEVVIMTKKERNLLERGAYAELSKEISSIREEIREGVVNEIEHDLIKNIAEYFREKAKGKVSKSHGPN